VIPHLRQLCTAGAVLLIGLLGSISCGVVPRLDYRLSIDPATDPRIHVQIRIPRVPREGMTLTAHAEQEVMGLSDVRVASPRAPVRFRLDHRGVLAHGKQVGVPYVTIAGPAEDVIVTYAVAPSRREGNEHTGYTGLCFGVVTRRFALVTGRSLFLVPRDQGGFRATVRFSLPTGWAAVAPWPRHGDAWRPRTAGAALALVSATLGLGRFREHSWKAGGTRYRFAVESGISLEDETRTLAALRGATRFVRDLFGRDPGPSYLTIIAPPSDAGDEIDGEGSALGQGGTLTPVTASRVRLFADRLISAFLLYPDTRAEIRDEREFWLVDAMRYWYSWRAAVAAGLIQPDDVTRGIVTGYASTAQYHNVDRDLERMYRTADPTVMARKVLAPASLAYLDFTLSRGSRESHAFDRIVPKLFRSRRAASLWSALPSSRSSVWEQFRRQYVQGRRWIPVEQMLPLAPTRPLKSSNARSARTVTLVYTGDSHGFLENCGCKVNQSGGVARRAGMLAEIRRREPDALLLDAGNAFASPEHAGSPDHLSMLEQGLYLRVMDAMRYDAAAVGATELALGPVYFRDMVARTRTPFLSANVAVSGRPLTQSSIVVRRSGLRIGVIGVLDPPRLDQGQGLFDANTEGLRFGDPIGAVRSELARLRPQVDWAIVMGRLHPYLIRTLIRECPGIDVVLSSEFRGVTRHTGSPRIAVRDESGFVGRTLVLYALARQYGMGVARLDVDQNNRIQGGTIEDRFLGEKSPDDSAVRSMLDGFYAEVGRSEAAQASVVPPFVSDPVRASGVYAGADRCRSCHEAEYAQWSTTPHASAYKTLLDAHRHYQPRCVSCHVVGYGTPYGYKLGTARETLANVQCEVCHGPGGNHVEDPSRTNIARVTPERVCLECHNPDHSDAFVYARKLPLVLHHSSVATTGSDRRQVMR